MKTSSAVAFLSIVALLATSPSISRAADNGPIGTPSAADLALLKSLGLDPKDPNLHAKFLALGEKRQAALLQKLKGESTKATVTPETTTPDTFGLAKAAEALGTSPGALVKNPSPRNDVPKIDRMSSVEGSVESTSTTDPYGRGKFKLRTGETFYISGTNLIGANGVVGVTGDFGNCGSFSMAATYLGSFSPPGSSKPLDILQVNVPAFNVDERVKDGKLTVHTSGGFDSVLHVGYAAALESVSGVIQVGDEPSGPLQTHAYSSTPFLGMVDGQTMATDGGGDRYSNFPDFLGGTGGSGTDEFGEGIDLEHGWSAVATVSSDAPGYDIDGVASIAPGVSTISLSKSLQIFVNWSFSASDNSAYYVRYVLTGPIGGVPLSTMPQKTDCAPVSF